MGMGGGVEESRRAGWKVLDFLGPATGPWSPPTGTVESLSQAGRPQLLLDDQGWPAGDTWCETRRDLTGPQARGKPGCLLYQSAPPRHRASGVKMQRQMWLQLKTQMQLELHRCRHSSRYRCGYRCRDRHRHTCRVRSVTLVAQR